MSALKFNEEKHEYTFDGRIIDSVTTILSGVGIADFSGIPDHLRDVALERGGFVHLATQFLDKGTLDWDTIDPMIEPYVRAYEKFKKDSGFVPNLIEHMGYNKVLDYAGTLDRTGTLNNRMILLDIKTGTQLPKYVKLQTAAYVKILPEDHEPVAERYGLLLRKDGTYRLSEPYLSQEDFLIFSYAKFVYEWIKRK